MIDVLDLLSAGLSPAEILQELPLLYPEDIDACIAHAAANPSVIPPAISDARLEGDVLYVTFNDCRIVEVSLAWYPRLFHGTDAERNRFQLQADGIHWHDLDEDISAAGILLGRRSGESRASLERWMRSREGQ